MENPQRAQAAMEFMITYAWALVIIAIAIGIFAYFLSIPQALVPPRCYFPYGITCRGIIIGPNTMSSNSISFIIVNSQQYNLVGPTYGTLDIPGYGSATANCSPANIIGGGVVLCSASLSKAIPTSLQVSGKISLSSSICLLGNIQDCQSSRPITYDGNFSSYVGGVSNGIPVNIVLYEAANTIGTGTPVLFTAHVTILGMPAPSALVSFSTNSPAYTTISPLYSLTDHGGNSTSYFSSSEAGSYNVIASFAGQSASNAISVT